MATRKFTLFELHVDDIHTGPFSLGGTDHDETDDADEAIESEEPSHRWLVPFVGLAGLVFGTGAIVYRRMRPDSDVVEPEVEVAVEGDETVTDEIHVD